MVIFPSLSRRVSFGAFLLGWMVTSVASSEARADF